METFFPFEIEAPEIELEPTINSYEEMITAILTQTPDPRFDND